MLPAFMFSRNCCGVVAPMMDEVTKDWQTENAIAIAAGVIPCFLSCLSPPNPRQATIEALHHSIGLRAATGHHPVDVLCKRHGIAHRLTRINAPNVAFAHRL